MKDLFNKIRNLKNFKDIEKLQLDQKAMLIIILALILIIYLDYNFLIKRQIKAISVVSPKVAKVKKDINDLNKNLLAIQDLKNKQATIERQKVKKIISQGEVALLLQDISELANNDGVKIMQMKPSREPGVKQENAAAGPLDPVLVTLDLVCGYHNLGKFINDLENAEIFIQVQNIKINEKEADSIIQQVNLVLRTYAKK